MRYSQINDKPIKYREEYRIVKALSFGKYSSRTDDWVIWSSNRMFAQSVLTCLIACWSPLLSMCLIQNQNKSNSLIFWKSLCVLATVSLVLHTHTLFVWSCTLYLNLNCNSSLQSVGIWFSKILATDPTFGLTYFRQESVPAHNQVCSNNLS